MKKAIKLTAILCALVLLMGLAGCDDKAAQTPKYETITVEMPVPKAWGMVWLNRRSWSAASFMITACGC